MRLICKGTLVSLLNVEVMDVEVVDLSAATVHLFRVQVNSHDTSQLCTKFSFAETRLNSYA